MSTQALSMIPSPPRALVTRGILRDALIESFVKLLPQQQWKNPVMFVVYVGSILTTVLWFTVLFANFAEAVAEGRSKAQAAALRSAKRDTMAKKLDRPRKGAGRSLVPSTAL